MYAIFEAKGKQWRAEPGATLRLPSLDAEPGDRVVFDDVLLTDQDGEVVVGRPSVEGAEVATEVVRHGKGEKVVVFKMKRRKNYRRKQGHRQAYTEVVVVDITLGGGKGAAKPRKKTAEPVAEAPKAGKAAKAEAAPAGKPAASKGPAAEEVVEQAIAEAEITPAAAELARENGLDISAVKGTGKDGRVLKSDVEKAIKARDEG